MKNILSLITFRELSVSNYRKRMFRLTLLVFGGLVAIRFLREEMLQTPPVLVSLFALLITVLLANLFANVIRLVVVSNHRKRRGIAPDERDNFTVGVNALVNGFTVIAFIATTFWVFDIAFQDFLNSIAIFAVALTLIFMDYIKNFLFGLSMMFSNDYEIGDYVQVSDMPKGVITTITFSSLHIKTESGDALFIPNTVIRSHQVTNFSKLKPKRINVEFSLLRDQVKSIDTLEKKILTHLDSAFPGAIEIERSHLEVLSTDKEQIHIHLELASKKASLKLKEQINRTVKKFAVEY